MPFGLIARAQQACQQRLTQAFEEFCGDAPGAARLELRDRSQLPTHEPIRLPYDDGSFDWVACHELIEIFGSHERKVRLLRELLRVARRGIFVSTPNRSHPLARWLYPERHPVLLDALTIKTMVDVLPGHPDWELGHVRLGGFKSHYFLMVWKGERQASSARRLDPGQHSAGSGNPPTAASRPAHG